MLAEALDLILLHSSSLASILSRKVITKGVLFRYLHARRVAVNVELSKAVLIEKTERYWAESLRDDRTTPADERAREATTNEDNTPAATIKEIVNNDDQQDDWPENFPIHRMSRQFTGWFFKQFNSGQLAADDFWCDAHCTVEMTDATAVDRLEQADGADACATALLALRDRFAFHFNANECHAGCQGRVDAHGLVLVLSCGTLHVEQRGFVGCWECAFGLVRDPFADNNWKVKHMRMRLRSVRQQQQQQMTAELTAGPSDGVVAVPQLVECEMLREMLALPAGEMDLV